MVVVPIRTGVYLVLYPGLASPADSVVAMIVSGGEYVVVDSGSGLPGSLQALSSGIAWVEERYGSLSPRLVILTHGHVNNAGGAWWLHDSLGLVVAARPPDSRWVEEGDPEKTASRELGIPFHPVPVGLEVRRDPLVVGVGSYTVEVHHTPGHTPGSQSVLVEAGDRVLFVGDSLGRLKREWGSSEDDWWRSLDRIRGLEPQVLCTSASCFEGSAVKSFLDLVAERGPEWIA